jgi:vacuolar-type H+-ATPase subunit E/Vma4
MALADLLRAIEADAEAERARAHREMAAEAAAILERAHSEAGALETALSEAPEAEAREDAARMLALARLEAASTVRSAREEAFASVLAGIGEALAALRSSDAYPAHFAALLAESRAALPDARELRIDPRDNDLALAGEPTLDTWGGLELASDDGRALRNTLEERLANAEPLLRRRFSEWL